MRLYSPEIHLVAVGSLEMAVTNLGPHPYHWSDAVKKLEDCHHPVK